MKDVFGIPQSVLIIGGNSTIAMAILEKLITLNRLEEVILVTKDGTWDHRGHFSALEDAHRISFSSYSMTESSTIEKLQGQDIDLCIIATGFLPKNGHELMVNIEESLEANTLVPIRFAEAIANHMFKQGQGLIIGLSSIASIRIRPSNWVYGVSKFIFDRYLQSLSLKMKNSGVRVHIVRPGMVRTRMSKHLREMPFTVDVGIVADEIVKNLSRSSRIIWVPRQLKYVAFLIRLLPKFLLNLLDRR